MALGYVAGPEQGAGLGLVVLADAPVLCDRFAAEGFTAMSAADEELDSAITSLLASDKVRGDGVGVLAFTAAASSITRTDVQAIVIVDPAAVDDDERPVQAHPELDDHAWTRTLEFLRAKLG
jgi:hypothetical protein